MKINIRVIVMLVLVASIPSNWSPVSLTLIAKAQEPAVQLPSSPLKFGAFIVRFDPGGTFTLQGQGWPKLSGNWKSEGSKIEFLRSGGPGGCDGPGRYQVRVDGKHVGFDLISDDCVVRRMIIDRSYWSPSEEVKKLPSRSIALTSGARVLLPRSKIAKGIWPSFRGPQ